MDTDHQTDNNTDNNTETPPTSYDDDKNAVADRLGKTWQELRNISANDIDLLLSYYHSLDAYQKTVFMRELKIDQMRAIKDEVKKSIMRQSQQSQQMQSEQQSLSSQQFANIFEQHSRSNTQMMEKVSELIGTLGGTLTKQGSEMSKATKAVNLFNENKMKNIQIQKQQKVELYYLANYLTTLKSNINAFSVNKARCAVINKGVKNNEDKLPFDVKAPGFITLATLQMFDTFENDKDRKALMDETVSLLYDLKQIEQSANALKLQTVMESHQKMLKRTMDMLSVMRWTAEQQFLQVEGYKNKVQQVLHQALHRFEMNKKCDKNERKEIVYFEIVKDLGYDKIDQIKVDNLINNIGQTSSKKQCFYDKKGQCYNYLYDGYCDKGSHLNGKCGQMKHLQNPLKKNKKRRFNDWNGNWGQNNGNWNQSNPNWAQGHNNNNSNNAQRRY